MPLVAIPDDIRQTILIDLALKSHTAQQETTSDGISENKNNPSEVQSVTSETKTISPSESKFDDIADHVKRKKYYADTPQLIYSTYGNKRFGQNDNKVERFLLENSICHFETFLATVKQGSFENLLQLNFVKNHFYAQDEHGNNALLWATFFDFTDMMEYLLEQKSPVDMRNYDSWRAIDIAAYMGNKMAVEILITHGGCEELEEQDCSALFLAHQRGHTQIVEILQSKIEQNLYEYEERRRGRVSIRW